MIVNSITIKAIEKEREIEREIEREKREIERERKREERRKGRKGRKVIKLHYKEDCVRQLNLCEFATLSAMVSNPSTIKEVSELESYCQVNQLKSELLEKIHNIHKDYDTDAILKDVKECRKKVKSNPMNAKKALVFEIAAAIYTLYAIGSEYNIWLILLGIFAFIIYCKERHDCKKDVEFNEYTSNFINNVFKE